MIMMMIIIIIIIIVIVVVYNAGTNTKSSIYWYTWKSLHSDNIYFEKVFFLTGVQVLACTGSQIPVILLWKKSRFYTGTWN